MQTRADVSARTVQTRGEGWPGHGDQSRGFSFEYADQSRRISLDYADQSRAEAMQTRADGLALTTVCRLGWKVCQAMQITADGLARTMQTTEEQKVGQAMQTRAEGWPGHADQSRGFSFEYADWSRRISLWTMQTRAEVLPAMQTRPDGLALTMQTTVEQKVGQAMQTTADGLVRTIQTTVEQKVCQAMQTTADGLVRTIQTTVEQKVSRAMQTRAVGLSCRAMQTSRWLVRPCKLEQPVQL